MLGIREVDHAVHSFVVVVIVDLQYFFSSEHDIATSSCKFSNTYQPFD